MTSLLINLRESSQIYDKNLYKWLDYCRNIVAAYSKVAGFIPIFAKTLKKIIYERKQV